MTETALAPDTRLVEAWRTLIGKAQTPQAELPVLPAVVLICFGGGSTVLEGGEATMAAVTFPCRLLGASLLAGDSALNPVSVTATVDARLGRLGSWASGSSPLYGTGTAPAMTSTAEATLSITNWVTELQPGDLLPARLTTFSGLATWLILLLWVRRTDVVGLGLASMLDASSTNYVDANGNTYVIR